MRDEIDHVQPADVLLVEQKYRVGILFAENGDEDVGPGDFLLARGLHVEGGPLQHSLETQRGLGFTLHPMRDEGRCFLEKIVEFLSQPIDIGATGLEHIGGG